MTDLRPPDGDSSGELDDDIGTSADAGPMPAPDLTPRSLPAARRRRWLPMLLVGAIVVLIGVVIANGLGDASLFFRNVDEAVAERDSLGERRFRLQGTVVPGTAVETTVADEPVVMFTVNYDGVEADIVHRGDPPQLFQDAVPVVLEGHWVQGLPAGVSSFDGGANDGWYFASDEMLVKHDNEYVADNGERLDDAVEGGGADPDAVAEVEGGS